MINVSSDTAGLNTNQDGFESDVPVKSKPDEEKVQGGEQGEGAHCCGLDERKDDTKVGVGEGMKRTKVFKTKKVQDCAVVYWLREDFFGHVVPRNGAVMGLAHGLIHFFQDRGTKLGSFTSRGKFISKVKKIYVRSSNSCE